MGILERLEKDMIDAAKSRDAVRLGAIRFARSELTNRRIELGRDLEDDDAIEVLARIAKRHRESIEQFASADRDDLVSRETRELAVVESYLPEKLGDAEIAELIETAIRETGAGGPGDIGRVMGSVMPKVKGRADGSAVKTQVLARLAGADEA